jgi:hypothetical protein
MTDNGKGKEPNVEAGDYIEDDPEAWKAWVTVIRRYAPHWAGLSAHVNTPDDAAEIVAGTMLSVLADEFDLYLVRRPSDD